MILIRTGSTNILEAERHEMTTEWGQAAEARISAELLTSQKACIFPKEGKLTGRLIFHLDRTWK